jgi:phosphoribosylanthranilate isomerase
VLLDAYTPDRYGGSGKTADWSLAAEYARDKGLPPLVLAGGLTPENVAEAIQSTLTSGVDTASGVESQPGRKSAELVQQFVAEARRGFAEISNPKSEI